MIIQRNIKDIDLNNKEANLSIVDDDMKQDEIFRTKLSKKHEEDLSNEGEWSLLICFTTIISINSSIIVHHRQSAAV